jgi:hypothetical protein
MGGWSTPRPGPFKPGTETGSGRMRKISPPPVLDPRTVHPVVCRYTDCAILAHTL